MRVVLAAVLPPVLGEDGDLRGPAQAGPAQAPGDRSMRATYLAVIVVEIVTLLALWWFQTTYGGA